MMDFVIDRKVEMLISSDTANGTTKSVGLGVIGFADAFEELKPDLIVVLGDRYEQLAIVGAATLYKIPIAHLHGGEITEVLMIMVFAMLSRSFHICTSQVRRSIVIV